MKTWYVIAREPREDGQQYVNVFGPFKNDTDAQAFAMDLSNDNGWENVEAKSLTSEEANDLATEEVFWPYESEPEEQEED